MAQINVNNIECMEKQRHTIHEKVRATYTIFEAGGEKYVQLDTYGEKIVNLPRRLANQFN